MSETLYIIDISSFVFRAYYSVGHLSRSDGTPTGAVFGVANMLLKLLEQRAPSHLAVAMDSKGPTFRKDIYPAYKANRPPPPTDLVVQFPLVEQLVKSFGFTTWQRDGFEADDIIATATARALETGLDVVIVSGDKDLMQLVGPKVTLLDTMKDVVYDAAEVEKKWGVPPRLLGDLLALVGDSSDNIPGVPKVGPKTAAPLLLAFDGLNGLYAHLDEIKSKATAVRLQEHEALARLSRELVTLCADVPISFDMDATRYSAPNLPALGVVLDALEFRQLKERLFGRTAPKANALTPDYHTVTDAAELSAIVTAIRAAGRFAVDLETTSVDAVRAEIVGVALAWQENSAVYIPVAHKVGPRVDRDVVLAAIGPILEDPTIGVVVQNIKYEDTIFRRHGIRIENVAFDPMLASYLLRVDGRSHKLDSLALEILGHRMISYEEVTEKSRGEQLSFNEVQVDRATEYSGEDALMALLLAQRMAPMVTAAAADSLLHEVEIPLARVLCGMELHGVGIDVHILHEKSKHFETEIEQLVCRAHDLAGREFNLASPKQLQEILFDELHLPHGKKTKTGFSTDSEVLEDLAPLHELPAVLVEHRLLSKLKNTYLDTLPRLMNPATGRIHTSYNQAVAATGRLSSSNPNLQNIPIRSDAGRDIRRAFVAAPGHLLVSADYSQVELRVLAHLSGDPALCAAFQQAEDVHARTARALFGYGDQEPVPREQRGQAKTVNFGVIYGKTDFSLAKELGIPRYEAKRFIEEYFRLYQGVAAYMEETIERAKTEHSVATILGRRRDLTGIDASNHNIRQQAERMARNTPIQGSAADLLKVAMIAVQRRLEKTLPAAKMILTVHDELVFEVPEDKVDEVAALAREEMEGAIALKVPLVVDIGIGPNWAQAH